MSHHHHDMPPTPPRLRPAEPDHPMELNGCLVPGDMKLMVRCLAEELLMSGLPMTHVRRMSHDPNYQALHGVRRTLGDEAVDRVLDEVAQRMGALRCTVHEASGAAAPATLTVSARPSAARQEGR